jgi:tetratricopeptide (TPR) repeat protein
MSGKKSEALRKVKREHEPLGKRRIRPEGAPVDRSLVFVIAILLVLVTLAVYWQTLGNGFLAYDDGKYVKDNPRVQAGLTSGSILWAFDVGYAANWHPLTWLSHMLDCQIYGLNPMGHHLTSLLIHVVNVLLLLWMLVAMTGCIWRSGFVAALFALHPLHVESVAWIAERKDVLSTLFWLLTMLAYVSYCRRLGLGRYLLVLLLFALGLMAKPMLVSLPLVLLLLDYWPLRRSGPDRGWGRLLLEKIPLFALSAASCVLTFVAQRIGGAITPLQSYTFGTRVNNAILSYAEYLLKMIWPRDLAVLYPYVTAIPAWQITAAGLALMGISVLAVKVAARESEYRYLAAGWLWYLATLVPVIGLVQVGLQSMADRYTYIPLLGIFIMIAWGIADVTRRLMKPSAVPALAVSAGIVVLALSACTWRQVSYWRDSITLWKHTIEATEHGQVSCNYLAHNNFGVALAKQGKLDKAGAEFATALKINQGYDDAHYNLGVFLQQQGKLDEAAEHFAAALRIKPTHPEAQYNVGLILAKRGRLDEAAEHFSEALRLNPAFADAHRDMAIARCFQGNYADAWNHVHLAEKDGVKLPSAFLKLLAEKMPEPPRK